MAEEEKKSGTSGATRQLTAQKALDRRHWAARIGISFNSLKGEAFKRMYPFSSRLFSLRGRNYHYLDEGQGEPVVMVHGNPTWSFFYRTLIKGLSGNYRCLVPDHIGCGLSEKPQRYRYTLEQHIVNLETWLEETLPPAGWNGGKINLVVHDWGGPIGLGYAVRHPERIRRLIILNTWAFTSGKLPKRIQICRQPYLGAFLVRGLNLFASLATEMTTVRSMSYRAKKAFTMPYNSWKNRIGIYRFIQDIPIERTAPSRRVLAKIEEIMPKVLGDFPMLIQWGMKDWCFTPAILKQWKATFPNAEVDEYKAGHYLLEDCGDQILRRVKDFLERPAP